MGVYLYTLSTIFIIFISGMVQGLPEGLSQRAAERGGVQKDLRQLLPLRRRIKIC